MLKYIRSIFSPRPSFFDLCVGGFLYITCFYNKWEKGVFLVFYTVFLVIISICMKPKREYRSLPLALLALWSLANVFIHSFAIYPISASSLYPNFYLMVEGFLYILFGILFLRTVIIYSTNLRYIYFLIPITIIPWYTRLIYVGSTTPVAALGLGIVIYLFLAKRFIWGAICSIMGIVAVWLNWSWICMKFTCRPMVWHQLIINMFYRPVRMIDTDIIDPGIELSPFLERFFNNIFPNFATTIKPWLAGLFGGGFSQYLSGEYIWVDKDKFGWIYRHNDYWHLAECLGPITLVFVIWFIISSLRTIGMQPVLILFMAVILICFFQLTMFIPDRAGIYLMIGAICITEGLRRREDEENNCM